MERLEDLNLIGLKIYQDDEKYCFTSDAVLLSRFARVKKGDVVADFCSGSGIVGIHLFGLNSSKINSVTLFEMQKPLFDLSVKSIKENNLEKVFSMVNCKVQDIGSEYNGKFSLITCNPPYAKVDSGEHDENPEIDVCRREVELTITELLKAVSRALKYGGRFCICHRADRLIDVVSAMKEFGIEPKILQFVSGKGKDPYLFLMEGVKGGKGGLKVLKTLIN
jgi:tRNA1(Val) A37 N6-methylase TrmN6